MNKCNVLTKTLFAIWLSVLPASGARAENLDLTEGTITTGGQAVLILNRVPIDSVKGSNFGYNIDLSLGYFIMDDLEIDLQLGSGGQFTSPVTGLTMNFGLGGRYYFAMGDVYHPYFGAMVQFDWTKDGTRNWNLNVPLSLGLLLALNSHVAIDLGLTAGLGWGLWTGAGSTPNIFGHVGYVGVRAFF